jgi:hypothetical protein
MMEVEEAHFVDLLAKEEDSVTDQQLFSWHLLNKTSISTNNSSMSEGSNPSRSLLPSQEGQKISIL